ncbi:hypothetical protein Noda2021_11440 [Candidatus Dependentiae bacterium Noda2021]|nr:hypothetical protein Noda2021_11440 [Candidatus Dependentiae bacterium Noda2021]
MNFKKIVQKTILAVLSVSSISYGTLPHGISVFTFSSVPGQELVDNAPAGKETVDAKTEKIRKYTDIAAWAGVATVNALVFGQVYSALIKKVELTGQISAKDCIAPAVLTGSLYKLGQMLHNKIRS